MSARKFNLHKPGRYANVTVHKTNGELCVRLHQTDVVRVLPSGAVILNSGGWRTVTTKTAINTALVQLGAPKCVHQDKGVWYVGTDRFNDGYAIPPKSVQA